MVVRELSEEVFRSGDGCLTWVSEKVVEANVVPSASEEEAVCGDCDFGEAAEAEAVVEKIDLRLKTQNCIFEGLHEFASMDWDWGKCFENLVGLVGGLVILREHQGAGAELGLHEPQDLSLVDAYAPAAFWLDLKEGANSFNERSEVDRCHERSYDRRHKVDVNILGDVHDSSTTRYGDGDGVLASRVRRLE